MSKSIKTFTIVGLVALVAACTTKTNNQLEEVVFVEPAPISIEPVYTGKFK